MRTLTHPKTSGSACMDYIIEEHSLKVREMQGPQEYAKTQVSEERRQSCRHFPLGIIKHLLLLSAQKTTQTQ